jgi:secreted trypsin-like serine protease
MVPRTVRATRSDSTVNPWPWASRLLSALGAVVLAGGGLRDSAASGVPDGTKGTAAVFRGAPDDASTYRATGAFLVRPFGSPFLVCTGTVIAPHVVLTAAHCVANHSKERLEFTLSPEALAAPAAASVSVLRAYVYPGYDLRSRESLHDIALVELDGPLAIPAFERLLSPTEAFALLRSGGRVELVGYAGKSHLGEKTVTRARVTSVSADEMAVGGPGLPQSCGGDSGGPAFVFNASGARRIAGVVSRSANDVTECVDGSIDTRVDAYDGWLTTTLATIAADEWETASPPGRGCAGSGMNRGDRGEGERLGAALITFVAVLRRVVFTSSTQFAPL